VREGEWIGEIYFDPEVEAKLRTKHNLNPEQVRQAVSCGAADWLGWARHPVYGDRLIAVGSDESSTMEVYLRPLDREDGTWECLTAWREEP
jgi:hypothetical protein